VKREALTFIYLWFSAQGVEVIARDVDNKDDLTRAIAGLMQCPQYFEQFCERPTRGSKTREVNSRCGKGAKREAPYL